MRYQQSNILHFWIAVCVLRANGAYGDYVRAHCSVVEEEGSLYCGALRKRNFSKVNSNRERFMTTINVRDANNNDEEKSSHV